MEGVIGSASAPSQGTHPCAASPSRFSGLQMRSATQANRTHDKGSSSRAAPYIAPSRERTEWTTPMRTAPARDPAGSPTPATPHASAYRASHAGKSRGVTGVGNGCVPNVARTGNSPDEGRRLSQRDKQVSYGYVTDGYKNMIRLVNHDPLLQSGGILPLSPPDVQRGSKRTWDIQLRKWRRALHMFDHVFIDGEDDEARRGDVIEQQRLQWINIAFLAPAAARDSDEESDTADGATTAKLSATVESAQSDISDNSESAAAAPLKPRVERVRLSLDALLAVRRSPLVPTKLPVEDELRCILASDDCFESVRNVVPQTASSLTRGTDISPLEAGIKIHIAPSAAVLRQQQEQQQRHQDTLQHTRQQSMPHADHSEKRAARPSPSLPQTVVGRGGGGESLWRRTAAVSEPAASTGMEDRYRESPLAPGRGVGNRGLSPSAAPGTPWSAAATATAGMESSPAPRRPGDSSASLWSPEPRLAPPPPLHHGAASSTLHSPSPMDPRQSAGHPHGPVMVMMMPTTMPDGSTLMIPAGFYTDPRAGGGAPMLLSPAAATDGRSGGAAAPCMPIVSSGVPGLRSPNGSWVDGLSSPQPVQPFMMMPFSSQPTAASSNAASMPRWRQSQSSRLRADDPQTVPRFVPMLSASKSESRLADRLLMTSRQHSNPTADVAVAAQGTKATTADPHATSPAVFSTPSNVVRAAAAAQRHDGDGDAQRALFTAADDDEDEGRTGATVPRATTATGADVGEASLLKVVLHSAHPHATGQLGDDAVAQDLFGQ